MVNMELLSEVLKTEFYGRIFWVYHPVKMVKVADIVVNLPASLQCHVFTFLRISFF
jgi:hypothetical protein